MAMLIIDGYNMIRRVPRLKDEEHLGLAGGRDALLILLEEYGALTSQEIVVVFDGSGRPQLDSGDLPAMDRFAGVDVVFSGKGQSADSVIMDIVLSIREGRGELPFGRDTRDAVVVTDDHMIRDEALVLGAFVVSVDAFYDAISERRKLYY